MQQRACMERSERSVGNVPVGIDLNEFTTRYISSVATRFIFILKENKRLSFP